MKRLLLAAAVLLSLSASAAAIEPDELLDDPSLEARARAISRELRCVVCQNQSIDDSNAPLARDLRILVRERLKAGDDDDEVIAYITARYGDFVLLRPPVRTSTYALWFGPPVVLALAALFLLLRARRRRAQAAPQAQAPLTASERRRLARLLKDDR